MKIEYAENLSALLGVLSVVIAFLSASLSVSSSAPASETLPLMITAAAIAGIAATIKIKSSRQRKKLKKKQIFLIYAREDQDKAMKVYENLKEMGFNPWIDTRELLPGQNWKKSIGEAIQESEYALALLSKNAVSKKGYVQKELKLALDLLGNGEKGFSRVIPVRLEDAEVPESLADLHWVDLHSEDGMNKLKQALQAQVN